MGNRAPAGLGKVELRHIELRQVAHIERLVRPLVVEAFDEVIELGLLLQEVAGGRLVGFELQSQMHALVETFCWG